MGAGMSMEKQQLFTKAKKYLDEWYDDGTCMYDLTAPEEACEKIGNICYSCGSSKLEPNMLETEPTFSQKLFEFIRKKGMSETECYKRAHLDRRLFSKIRSDDDYQPKKDTVFALIFGLKLNLEDAESLLEAAGYSISHSLKKDVLIEFLIKEKKYDIITVNEVLHKFRCSLLGSV